MKKIEIGLICVILLAFIWKILDYPFGDIMMIISVLILSSLYFYLGFALFNGVGFRKIFKKESYKGTTTLRIIGSILIGITISIILLGILFKMMMWPFGSQLLIIGILGLLISLILVIIKFVQKRSKFYKEIFLRTIGYTIIGIFLYFSGTFFLELKYGDYPEYIEVVKKLDKEPDNIELQQQEKELYQQIRYDRTGQR